MSRSHLLAPVAAIALATSAARPLTAHAQFSGARVSFEPALTTWLGPMLFGHRLKQGGSEAGYRSSIALGARGEYPLSRRTGLMVNVALAPFSRQQTETAETDRAIWGKAVVYRADAGVSFRFKPTAPVFFYAGGGVVGATKYAWPVEADISGTPIDPQAAFAVGYDGARRGRWNFRATYAGFVVFPTASGSQVEAKATAYDWSVQLGARYALRSAP